MAQGCQQTSCSHICIPLQLQPARLLTSAVILARGCYPGSRACLLPTASPGREIWPQFPNMPCSLLLLGQHSRREGPFSSSQQARPPVYPPPLAALQRFSLDTPPPFRREVVRGSMPEQSGKCQVTDPVEAPRGFWVQPYPQPPPPLGRRTGWGLGGWPFGEQGNGSGRELPVPPASEEGGRGSGLLGLLGKGPGGGGRLGVERAPSPPAPQARPGGPP